MPPTNRQAPAKQTRPVVQLHNSAPRHKVVLARYVLGHFGRVLALAAGGTALAWLGVWWKVSNESRECDNIWCWIEKDIWNIWKVNSEPIYGSIESLGYTLILVTCALILSGLFSVWIGWKTSHHPHTRRWDAIDYTLNILGGVPVFFLCFLVRDQRYELIDGKLGWLLPVLAVAILAWGEGNASLWTRMFRRQFERVRRAPHIQAAQGRGLPVGPRLWRDSAGMAIESIGSRAVILLGGASIIEYMLDHEHGIGGAIIRQFAAGGAEADSATWAAQVFVLVVAVAILRGIDAVTRDWTRRRVVGQS